MRTQSWAVVLVGLRLLGCGGATMPVSDSSPDSNAPDPSPSPSPSPSPNNPAEPAPPGGFISGEALAVRKWFFGETNRSGTFDKDAWKSFGRNIDGLVSTKESSNVCKRAAGASSSNQVDGDQGIDNAFGKIFVPFLAPFVSNPTKRANEAIEAGARTPVLVVAPSASPVTTVGFGILEATSSPGWGTGAARPFAEAWTTNGAPSVTWDGSVSGNLLRTRAIAGAVMLSIPFGNESLVLPVNVAEVAFSMSGSEGTFSGVVPTEAFITAFERVSGSMSTQLCGGSTRDSIRQTIRQASDILQDGTQDPNRECDGISIGLGFEASPVVAGGVAPAPAPKPDPCQ